MTEVFNSDILAKLRRLNVKNTVALHAHESLGREISIVKERMARQIAQKIMESPEFFKQENGGQYVTYHANVIVLTDDELAQVLREQFRKGIDHASGFMPTYSF